MSSGGGPLYFEHLIGQTSIKDHLVSLIEKGRLPHSLLFHGPGGLGKLDMAIGLASTILGRSVFSGPRGSDYLKHVNEVRSERGESDKKIEEEGLSIYQDGGDAFWLRPIKKTLKVEQWYQLLRDHLNVAGQGQRVVIVEDFHKANAIMANAMLKTIEEPPEGVFFIILTNTINTVLPTIISRCMCIPFLPLSDATIRQALQEKGVYVTDAALMAGQGNPTLVRQLAEQGSIRLLDMAVKIMDGMVHDVRYFALASLDTESLERDELIELFHWMRILCRDMMALRYGAADQYLQCPLHKGRLLKMLPRWRTGALERLVRESLQAQTALRLYIKPALAMDGLILAVSQALQED